jgi:UDP-GlcNAc:undecaprenyl-phosphate GlcNAc-1-phosphate transferase
LLNGEARLVALGLAGALAGFLVFNRPPARIYLGDAGAYGLGAALALLLATSWSDGIDASRSIAALPLVAIPLTDTTIAVVRRWRAHRPLFEGDRGHIYDQLVDRGLRPVTATSACVAAQAVLVVVAIAASRLDLAAASALIAACALVVLATAAAGHFLSPDYARSSA